MLAASFGWQTLGATAEQAGTSKVPGNAWPPKRAGSANAAALTPEEAMATFSVPPGYHVELVAAEPMVDSPILLDFDADGRMWVVEMPGFLPDESGQDSKEPIDRIVVLEDTNDDGKMDKRTIFADKLDSARAIKVLDQGVLLGIPPNLWPCGIPTATSRPTRGRLSSRRTAAAAASNMMRTACCGRWTTSYSSEHTGT